MKIHQLALILGLSMGLSSCVAAAVAVAAGGGIAYWQYSENEVCADFQADLKSTWEAARTVLAQQGFGDPTAEALGVTEGELSSDGWKLHVERRTGDVTRVRVRIGTFDTDDHERRARLLMEGIGEKLGVAGTDPDAQESAETAHESPAPSDEGQD